MSCTLGTFANTKGLGALVKTSMKTHDSAAYNQYFLFPWGSRNNREPGSAEANVHLNSRQGWTAAYNNYPNGVIIDAAVGKNEDRRIYGVLLQSRYASDELVKAVSVSIAPASADKINIDSVVINSAHIVHRNARPTEAYCKDKHPDCVSGEHA